MKQGMLKAVTAGLITMAFLGSSLALAQDRDRDRTEDQDRTADQDRIQDRDLDRIADRDRLQDLDQDRLADRDRDRDQDRERMQDRDQLYVQDRDQLRDREFLSAGGYYRFSNWTSGGVFLDYRQSSVPGNDSIRELTASLSRRMADDWRLQAYLVRGLCDTSLNWGAGLSVRLDL